MSVAVTKGELSYVKPQGISEWDEIDYLMEQLAPRWKIVNIQPERQEFLLQARNSVSWNPEEIREILQELQQRTQRSFVALMNSARQYALIMVRG
ncbi:MAG: hypothetical protein ACFFCZ_03850 [Promethearchaeota archaeon]